MAPRKITLNINESAYIEANSKDIISYWVLVFVLDLRGEKELLGHRGMGSDDVVEFLGLTHYADNYDASIRIRLIDALNGLKKTVVATPFTYAPTLENNLQKLKEIIDLSSIEIDVLRFCIYLHYYDILDSAGRLLNDITTDKFEHALSKLLGYTKSQIREVFRSQSALVKNSILKIDRNGSRSMRSKVDMATNGFADKMMSSDDDIETMMKDAVKKCNSTHLSIADYPHLSQSMDVVLPYIKHVIESKKTGSNILFYGYPGTGKTELVKTIAKTLKVDLYEVNYEDEDGDPIEGVSRLQAYRTAQSLFSKKQILLMFDEIEDVLNNERGGFMGFRKRQSSKGWINRMLESNPIPTIWITNNIESIDDAIIRRFDITLEVPIPPKRKRQDIIMAHSSSILDTSSIELIAENENVSPALLSRAADVIKCIQSQTSSPSEAYKMLIDNTLKAQGHKGLSNQMEGMLPPTYDSSFVNTSADLQHLMEGMKRAQSARLCLYGAPGTGKSAFGKWIAKEMDLPFLLKKGSDLMSMWVGGTEKNIAAAFREASDENAVLVFDEVDSFLQDRRNAQASWEVTQVNEMLVQMENFQGIFIATTNLMEGLDQASLRRFDLKLEFGYLKAEQASQLFVEEAKHLGIKNLSKPLLKDVEHLHGLTPGDFAAVRRQSRFSPIVSAHDFYERLVNEVGIKMQDSSKKMGFL